jgi:hypothetical protein
VEHPVELIPNIAVQGDFQSLSAYKPFFGGKHVVIIRVTGAGSVKKPDFTLSHRKSIHDKTQK